VPSPAAAPAATSAVVRRTGKGASTMKKSWSVFKGPAFGSRFSRTRGLGLPSWRREWMTVCTAIGATSMGMEGQFVRRRGWSLR